MRDPLVAQLWATTLICLQDLRVFHLCPLTAHLYQGLAIIFHRAIPTTLIVPFMCLFIQQIFDSFLCAKQSNKHWEYKNTEEKELPSIETAHSSEKDRDR